MTSRKRLLMFSVLLTGVFLVLILHLSIFEYPYCDEGHIQYGITSICRARELR